MKGQEEHYDLAQIILSGRAASREAEGGEEHSAQEPSQREQLKCHRLLADALVHLGQAFHLPERVLRLLARAAAGDKLDRDEIDAISIAAQRPSPLVSELTQDVARVLDPEAFAGPDLSASGHDRRETALAKARSVLAVLGLTTEITRSGSDGVEST